jgi:hypothetical protein
MSPTEAVQLVRYIEGGCPSMRISENTPDVWYDDGLNEIPFDVALDAAKSIIRTSKYVSLNELLDECEAIERARRAAVRRAELERDDPERFAIESAKPEPWPTRDESEEETKRKARRKIFADSFAKAKIAREVPPADPRPEGTRMAEARAEVDRVRKAQQPAPETAS